MHVVSHPEADQELEAAALWYEERQPDMGNDFLDEFEYTLRRIVADAGTLAQNPGRELQAQLPPLPYAIVYSVRGDLPHIKAVMHLHRRPFYWPHR